jgi:histone H3/H4
MRGNQTFWIIIVLGISASVFAEELAHQAIRGDLTVYEEVYLSSDDDRILLYTLRRDWEKNQSFNFLDEETEAYITGVFEKAMEAERQDREEARKELEELAESQRISSDAWEELDQAFQDYVNTITISPHEVFDNVPLKKIHRAYSEKIVFIPQGDFLIKITEKLYDDYRVWKQLYEYNKENLPQPWNSALILPEMKLVLPPPVLTG